MIYAIERGCRDRARLDTLAEPLVGGTPLNGPRIPESGVGQSGGAE